MYSQFKVDVQNSGTLHDSNFTHYDLIFKRILHIKKILGWHAPKCQHLFYLTNIYSHYHVRDPTPFTADTAVNKEDWGAWPSGAYQPVALSLGGRILQREFLFFFNQVSEVATCNTFERRESYHLKNFHGLQDIPWLYFFYKQKNTQYTRIF